MAVATPTKLRIKSGSLEVEFEGSETFLRSDVHKLVKAVNDLPTSNVILATGILKRELEASLSTLGELETQVEDIKRERDSLSEISEMQSLRMQMMMDRLSKAISTISNIMKKLSETSSGIIQNLK